MDPNDAVRAWLVATAVLTLCLVILAIVRYRIEQRLLSTRTQGETREARIDNASLGQPFPSASVSMQVEVPDAERSQQVHSTRSRTRITRRSNSRPAWIQPTSPEQLERLIANAALIGNSVTLEQVAEWEDKAREFLDARLLDQEGYKLLQMRILEARGYMKAAEEQNTSTDNSLNLNIPRKAQQG